MDEIENKEEKQNILYSDNTAVEVNSKREEALNDEFLAKLADTSTNITEDDIAEAKAPVEKPIEEVKT